MKDDAILKVLAWERAYRAEGDPMTIVELLQDLIDSGDIQYLSETFHDLANRMVGYGFCTRPTLKVVK